MIYYVPHGLIQVKHTTLLHLRPGPAKQDKCVNEVIFCQKNAENNF